MAIVRMSEIHQMSTDERKSKVSELRNELLHERGVAAMGGAPISPGKIRSLRTSIARILTVMNEEGET
jgi:large subunit ribosomal protein L29